MTTQSEVSREVRIEGLGLVLVGGLLVGLVSSSFFLGRWVERRNPPAAQFSAAETDPLGGVVPVSRGGADVDAGTGFFDRVDDASRREPERELPTALPAAPERAEPAPSRDGAATAAAGPFWVQVSAGRDRRAAEQLVRELRRAGWSVQPFVEAEGAGALIKVRVGGYADRDAATRAAGELKAGGYSGAWVTEVD